MSQIGKLNLITSSGELQAVEDPCTHMTDQRIHTKVPHSCKFFSHLPHLGLAVSMWESCSSLANMSREVLAISQSPKLAQDCVEKPLGIPSAT